MRARARDKVKKYMRINGLQGKGALTRALNEMTESFGEDHNVSDYIRVESFIKKSTLKNIAVFLIKDPEFLQNREKLRNGTSV